MAETMKPLTNGMLQPLVAWAAAHHSEYPATCERIEALIADYKRIRAALAAQEAEVIERCAKILDRRAAGIRAGVEAIPIEREDTLVRLQAIANNLESAAAAIRKQEGR